MILALTIAIVAGTMLGSLLYGKRQARAQTVTEWAVGGRRMGTLIFWFLNAGEIYTTFAVLGISGYAWAYGAPAYLAFCSVSLAAAIGYWLTPLIWAAGRDNGLITQADFFDLRYGSRALSVVVAVAGIAALVIYVQIQLTALSVILQLSLGRPVSMMASTIVAALLMLTFVFFAGLRSAAFAAGVKDVLMLVIVVALSATVADKVGATSIIDLLHRAETAHPGLTSLPGLQPEAGLDTTWLITAALNVALGTYIFPHMFQLCYAARDSWTIKRNAIFQPLYSLSFFFIILLGFGALLAQVQPPGGDLNAALLQFVADSYPAWAVGVLAGTACLLALVPGSVLLLAAGSIFSRNVLLPLRPGMGEKGALIASRAATVGFAGIAVYLTLGGSRSLVDIGLMAYSSIGMLAPGVFLAFLWPRTNAAGVAAGLAVGYAVLLLPGLDGFWAYFPNWEKGLVAMAANALTLAVVVMATTRRAVRATG
ncbi:sodium:solute symporter family protein [Sphingomonas flavalba]|uniref:sodium:solute symporter family protein n=1 Tax=Sphingomonas flavalba TaxID=2559804 RepID=UPI0039E06F80